MRKKKAWLLLVFSLLSLAILIYLIFACAPNANLQLFNLQLPILPFFFLFVFIFLASLVNYCSKSKLQGILIAGFSLSYLYLRFLGLLHPFFLFLLLALLIVIELFLRK